MAAFLAPRYAPDAPGAHRFGPTHQLWCRLRVHRPLQPGSVRVARMRRLRPHPSGLGSRSNAGNPVHLEESVDVEVVPRVREEVSVESAYRGDVGGTSGSEASMHQETTSCLRLPTAHKGSINRRRDTIMINVTSGLRVAPSRISGSERTRADAVWRVRLVSDDYLRQKPHSHKFTVSLARTVAAACNVQLILEVGTE